MANIRQDFLHTLTTRLAKSHSEIVIEELNVLEDVWKVSSCTKVYQ